MSAGLTASVLADPDNVVTPVIVLLHCCEAVLEVQSPHRDIHSPEDRAASRVIESPGGPIFTTTPDPIRRCWAADRSVFFRRTMGHKRMFLGGEHQAHHGDISFWEP